MAGTPGVLCHEGQGNHPSLFDTESALACIRNSRLESISYDLNQGQS